MNKATAVKNKIITLQKIDTLRDMVIDLRYNHRDFIGTENKKYLESLISKTFDIYGEVERVTF